MSVLIVFACPRRRTHLAFTTQSPKELVALKLGLLIGHNARHLEDEPGRPWLFVQAHPVEWQHADAGMFAHRVHHPRRRGSIELLEWCHLSRERHQITRSIVTIHALNVFAYARCVHGRGASKVIKQWSLSRPIRDYPQDDTRIERRAPRDAPVETEAPVNE